MDNTNNTMMRSVFAEALRVSPNIVPAVAHDIVPTIMHRMGEMCISRILYEATPHGRFQMLAALLLSLCVDTAVQSLSAVKEVITSILNGFYLGELATVLSALA